MTTNYRGITLLCTAHKLYAAILNERFTADMEKKKILSDTQAGFRKERCTIDNIYVLQYVVEKKLRKKGGKVYGFFVDLRTAFDSVNRDELWETMQRKGIRKGLIERIKEIYQEGSENRDES